MRKIFGAVQGKEEWKIVFSEALYQFYKLPNIIIITVSRSRRAGHVKQKYENELTGKIMKAKPKEVRE